MSLVSVQQYIRDYIIQYKRADYGERVYCLAQERSLFLMSYQLPSVGVVFDGGTKDKETQPATNRLYRKYNFKILIYHGVWKEEAVILGGGRTKGVAQLVLELETLLDGLKWGDVFFSSVGDYLPAIELPEFESDGMCVYQGFTYQVGEEIT